MTSVSDQIREEAHKRGLVYMVIVVLVAVGLRYILVLVMDLSDVTEIAQLAQASHLYLWVGLLLFTLGVFWYGYLRGYSEGHAKGFERGTTAEREKAQK